MDPQAPPPTTPPAGGPTTPPSSQPTPPPVHKKGGLFSLLGKILLFLVLAGGLIVGGFFVGQKVSDTSTVITPTPSTQAAISPTPIPPSPTAASQTTKTVKAGLTGSTAFSAYSIDVPTGWIDARETTVAADIDKLTLTKDGYSVTIYQAAMGGGGCLYPGDTPSEMAQTFTDFSDINGKSGQFRRSWTTPGAAKTISYAICQKSTVDESYGSITSFGATNVVSPNPANATVLAEIDGMIASMIKQ